MMGTELEAYPLTIQELIERKLDASCDAAIVGVDNNTTRVFTARHFRRLKIPVIIAGVDRKANFGYVFIQHSNKESPCFGCLFPDAVNDSDTNPKVTF